MDRKTGQTGKRDRCDILETEADTLSDGTVVRTYSNYAEQPMLTVTTSGTNNWYEFTKYDANGNVTLSASTSAITGYDEQYADLLHWDGDDYQYLSDSAGLIYTTTYYTSNNTDPDPAHHAGGVIGYQHQSYLKHGETGAGILQSAYSYYTYTVDGVTINPMATSTVYRNEDGTGGQTTSYSYEYVGGKAQIASMTTSLPVVSAGQNGPGTADVSIDVFNGLGQLVWSKDADGFITYSEYDAITGATIRQIEDVDTSLTSDEPAGWSTPTGGGLHLQTVYTIDSLGRTTQTTDPAGRITRTEYDDANHEVRSYAWDSAGAGSIIGPISISREDRQYGYSESRTLAADGTTLLSLSRTYTNSAGQVSHSDQYFDFTPHNRPRTTDN